MNARLWSLSSITQQAECVCDGGLMFCYMFKIICPSFCQQLATTFLCAGLFRSAISLSAQSRSILGALSHVILAQFVPYLRFHPGDIFRYLHFLCLGFTLQIVLHFPILILSCDETFFLQNLFPGVRALYTDRNPGFIACGK